jgi:hypothetical protein
MPAMTGVPAGSPVAADAASVTVPTISAHGTTGGSLAASSWSASSSVGDHAWRSVSKHSVNGPCELSMLKTPVSLWTR